MGPLIEKYAQVKGHKISDSLGKSIENYLQDIEKSNNKKSQFESDIFKSKKDMINEERIWTYDSEF